MEIKYVENQEINEKVAEVIEELKEELVSRFHPKSIILTGSFGRGEATVFEKNGRLQFLSDCEVILIPYKWIFRRKELDEFEQDFFNRTGLKVGIWGVTYTCYLYFPLLNRKIKPTIANYDLKYGSKVIYGKNYLDNIPAFKPEDIPLWEGIRLLFNRMAEALEYYSPRNPTKEMVFWTDKIILACQDALLLSIHKYHPSYKKRNEIFQNVFGEYFSWLRGNLPHFLKLTIEATESKLGIKKRRRDDAIRYWFETVKASDIVFRYIVWREFGFHFRDYIEFQKKYIENVAKKMQNFFNFFQEPVYIVKALCYKNSPLLTRIKQLNLWRHITYSLIPLCYFSTSGKTHYLERVKELLEEFNIQNSSNNDYCVTHAVLSMWRGLC